jgi:hypothetical protein
MKEKFDAVMATETLGVMLWCASAAVRASSAALSFAYVAVNRLDSALVPMYPVVGRK